MIEINDDDSNSVRNLKHRLIATLSLDNKLKRLRHTPVQTECLNRRNQRSSNRPTTHIKSAHSVSYTTIHLKEKQRRKEGSEPAQPPQTKIDPSNRPAQGMQDHDNLEP